MYRFVGKRNDERVNSHNRPVLQTWRANIDWSAVTTVESVTQYIANYEAKSEPTSKNYLDIMREVVNDKQRPCRDSTSAIKRLLIKSASERDISAQEVCHLLMGYHLIESSRKVVVLNLNENNLLGLQLRRRRGDDDTEHQATDPSFFRRYLDRPDDFQSTTLMDMAKKYHYYRGQWRKYNVQAVVRIIPEFVGNAMQNTDQWELFCRQKVLLNSCYINIEEAKRGFQTWSECFAELSNVNESQHADLNIIGDEFEEQSDPEDETQEEWMQAAGMAPDFRHVAC